MFAQLEEGVPLTDRIRAFKNSVALLWERYREPNAKKKHFQDDRAVCRYLFFLHPEKYYLYQYGKYMEFTREIGLEPGRWSADSAYVPKYMDLADCVREELEQTPDLLSMMKERLDNSWYQDKNHHLLADDVFWFTYSVLCRKNYWPGENEYEPGIDAEQWRALLRNESVCSVKRRRILLQMMSMGGEATCTQLVQRYGENYQYYQNNMSDLAQAVQGETGCPIAQSDEGEKKYWPILFIGRKASDGQPGSYSWKLREELSEALESLAPVAISEDTMEIGKNTILYGPPGTGKTYQTVNYAVAIIEGKPLPAIQAEDHGTVLTRFQQYREAGRIAFITFHQSYGYEDFMEGIRPVLPDEGEADSGLSYDLEDGVFKTFCGQADYAANSAGEDDYGFSASSTVWKVSLAKTGENEIRTYCMNNGCIRIGLDEYPFDLIDETEFKHGGKNVWNAFANRMQVGDIVLSCFSYKSIDAIGVVEGEPEWHDEFSSYRRLRKVRWLIKGKNLEIGMFHLQKKLTLSTVYRLKTTAANVSSVLRQLEGSPRLRNTPAPPCVFIIDEINRGNISKIFGELITLIEPEKRKGRPEYIPGKLTYSQSEFGVPDNVWILGTMNTADRSIALLDTALRRRFQFRELMPDCRVLDGITVEGVSVSSLLETLNRRISALYDREHTLGHAWFLPLREDATVERLGAVFRDSVIPLLQEYFYDDYEKIRLVLGDEKRKNARGPQFFQVEEANPQELFGADVEFPMNASYRLNPETLINIEAYQNL